ncbi:MAG: SPOR domain-containing protein [Pseudomonadota bacterium]
MAPAPRIAAPVATITPPQPTTPPAQRQVQRTTDDCTSRPFFNSSGVRCGPQVENPSAGTRMLALGETFNQGEVIEETAVPPPATTNVRRVAVLPPVPEGYRRAWTDGRLNPLRGIQPTAAQPTATVSSSASAAPAEQAPFNPRGYLLAWTPSEPYLLYDRRTGFVVGDEFPELTHPNLTPPAATGEPVRATVSTRSVAPQVQRRAIQPQVSAPKPQQTVNRHIQAGTFADMAKARAAAQRLANTGMRTRIGKYRANGQPRQVIVLGPFESASALNRGLATARSLGFTSAIARK